MKVVVSGYVGKKITGIGRNLINLLDNSKCNQYVIYTNYDIKEDFVFKNKSIIVKTYKISKMSSIKNLLWTSFVFPWVVLKEKADLALIPNFSFLLIKFKPTVVIIHDLIEFNVNNKFSKLKMFYRKKIADPSMVKHSSKIITVSENSKRDIIKFLKGKKEKIFVIYNGVDQKKFHEMDKDEAQYYINNKKWPDKYIMYAGTIDHPGKNAMGVIKAFEELRENEKYTGELVLVGMPGRGYEQISDYIDNSKFRSAITVTGYVTDEELIALYSNCDSFVFLSLYEGFGIPPLEAMACGAKTVVSNTSSLPEVVGDIGITVNPLNEKNVVDAIERSINNKNDNEEKKAVREHLKKFSWDYLSDEFEKVLLDCK